MEMGTVLTLVVNDNVFDGDLYEYHHTLKMRNAVYFHIFRPKWTSNSQHTEILWQLANQRSDRMLPQKQKQSWSHPYNMFEGLSS